MAERDLNRQLISLACMEYKILSVIPPPKTQEEVKADEENKAKEAQSPSTMSKPQSELKKASASKTIKKTITNNDSFCVNDKFRSQMKRITINSIQRKESKKETDAVHEKVISDRKFALDAIIVKIMKGRKTAKHFDLFTDVTRLAAFPFGTHIFNARIEWLIDNYYLERQNPDDEESTPDTVYVY